MRVSFVHDDVQFLLRRLRRIDIVGQGQHSARGADFDDVGAEETEAISTLVISVAVGRADGMHGYQHARTLHCPGANSVAQADVKEIRRAFRSRMVVKTVIRVLRLLTLARKACSATVRCKRWRMPSR